MQDSVWQQPGIIQVHRNDQGAMEDSSSAIVRAAAFAWLRQRLVRPDDTLSRTDLEQGFENQGERVRLVGPQGIFKPAQIKYYPLSITTTTNGPYEDSFDAGGQYLLYSYRGTDPNFHENRRLRDAMRDKVPLIYFFGTVPGQYLAVAPVYIVGDDPAKLRCTVAADDFLNLEYERDDTDDSVRRGYVTRLVRQRIHQRSFRDRVLRAYHERCSVCRLKHARLLDAAHITPDTDEGGEPVVSNGLSLCKIHHAAFDGEYFGIRPDYRIVVRPDIMDEQDGPMLKHGLQEIHKTRIVVPRHAANKPDPDRLESRFNSFAESARL
ncbi:MAG: HNH endonuclease [Proteobacteria bacterium]|nr:HNH endonuclease [Pseudomonadota bacterium]